MSYGIMLLGKYSIVAAVKAVRVYFRTVDKFATIVRN